jgi:hypothetical protein
MSLGPGEDKRTSGEAGQPPGLQAGLAINNPPKKKTKKSPKKTTKNVVFGFFKIFNFL